MDLTTIVIPGKNKRRKYCKKSTNVSRSKIYHDNEEVSTSSKDVCPCTTRKKRVIFIKSRQNVSWLEKIPTEILEIIFFYCFNFELPRSSLSLGKALSSHTVYARTIQAAFEPTWRKSYCLRAIGENECNTTENVELQSAILRCRWASLAMLLKVKRFWIRNFHFSQPLNAKIEFDPQEMLDQCFKKFSDITNLREKIPEQYEFNLGYGSDFAGKVEIPTSLITGPWSGQMLKYFFWILLSWTELDSVKCAASEKALEGLKRAILIGDIKAIYLLVWMSRYTRCGYSTLIFEQNIDGCKVLIWALHNVGGDALAVMSHLLTLAQEQINEQHIEEIQNEITDMKFDLYEANDEASLVWILQLANFAQTLRARRPFTFGPYLP
ncbi:hypothetical protein GcC1_012036 [Golovinomyces cichoracearum]|uniref:Actin cortical patch protein n=1 Tax=Golovinomyces cichoracearum TaxID=62708 RepID=A0A420J789_9PEZI|nr:hypothetical protein GcC1_012036 [Golovinomyces cichoracearum]